MRTNLEFEEAIARETFSHLTVSGSRIQGKISDPARTPRAHHSAFAPDPNQRAKACQSDNKLIFGSFWGRVREPLFKKRARGQRLRYSLKRAPLGPLIAERILSLVWRALVFPTGGPAHG